MAKASKKVGAMKPSARKRTLNAGGKQPPHGAPPQEQDTKRRLGNFEGAGEHSRVGGRTTGIVGQTKQRFRANKAK